MDSCKKYCGLDISTSCIGIAILQDNKIIFQESYFPTYEKTRNLEYEAWKFSEHFENIYREFLPHEVILESPMKKFRTGLSSAHVISLLNRFHGMISFVVYNIEKDHKLKTCSKDIPNKNSFFKVTEVQLLEVKTARKLINFKKKTKDIKKDVTDYVFSFFPEFKINYTKKGNLKKGIADVADAVVLAWAKEKEKNDNL